MKAILYDTERSLWYEYENPLESMSARTAAEVERLLGRVQSRCRTDGLFAVGYLLYEAAPAFDCQFPAHPSTSNLPLARFGLFKARREHQFLPQSSSSVKDWAVSSWRGQPDFPDYQSAFDEVKEELARGNTYQINLTWRQQADFSGDPFNWFTHLCAKKPGSYLAYIEEEDYALLSLSPELFFSLEGNKLTMKPMKGTAAPGATEVENRKIAQELASDPKNRAENLMITDMIRNDCGRLAVPGSVAVPRLYQTEIFPTVIQMTSTVTAEVDQGLFQLFKALFPCASITGAPKLSAMKIIKRLESDARGIYTGTIGRYDPDGRALFNVAIRTVAVDKKRHLAVYGTGSGLIWDSRAETEYAECALKTRVVHNEADFYVFDSMLLSDGHYYLLERHLRRLADSCAHFDHPLDTVLLRRLWQNAARENPEGKWKVRSTVNRDGMIRVSCDPPPALREPYTLKLAKNRVDPEDPFLRYKTSERGALEAALESAGDCADVILVNSRGELTETSRANLVVVLDGIRYTPPLSSGILSGVLRAELLEAGEIFERLLYPEDLERAEAVFIINSIRGYVKAVYAR